MTFRIGLVQMNSQNDKSENLVAAKTNIRKLAGQGAQLIMCPEHFNYLGPDADKDQQAETIDGSPSLEVIGNLAAELNVYIHVGSFLERDGEKIFNTGVVLDPAGTIVAKYRKIHLFDVEVPGGKSYLESALISPGTHTATFTIGTCIFGMATCYDLRFPELFRDLANQGAHVLLLPAAFTMETGRDHWELLLRARAVENQCWVAAVNQWGESPPHFSSYGRSMVVDPWGVVVAQAVDGASTIIADLDLELLASIRATFPALTHRRGELF